MKVIWTEVFNREKKNHRPSQGLSFTTDLWEASIRLCVVVKDAAVGSRVQQSGVVISGRAAGAL